MRLSAYGITIELPRGWDGRIYRRPGADPTLHAANFPLPGDDADFGSGALAHLPQHGVFFALKEYRAGPHLRPGVGLYASRSISLPLRPSDFNPRALQVGRPRQVGYQHFFTAAGERPFCLYAVLSTPVLLFGISPFGVAAAEQVSRLSGVLSSLTIGARP
jgi:hypothetical protein